MRVVWRIACGDTGRDYSDQFFRNRRHHCPDACWCDSASFECGCYQGLIATDSRPFKVTRVQHVT